MIRKAIKISLAVKYFSLKKVPAEYTHFFSINKLARK